MIYTQVIQLLEEEETRFTPKHMTDVLNLVKKEEALEMEGKIAKSLHFNTSNSTHQASDVSIKEPMAKMKNEAPLAQRPVTKPCDVKVDYLFTVDKKEHQTTSEQISPFLMEEPAGLRPTPENRSL